MAEMAESEHAYLQIEPDTLELRMFEGKNE